MGAGDRRGTEGLVILALWERGTDCGWGLGLEYKESVNTEPEWTQFVVCEWCSSVGSDRRCYVCHTVIDCQYIAHAEKTNALSSSTPRSIDE